MLKPHGKPNQVRRDSRRQKLFVCHLAVRMACRMQNAGPRIRHMRHNRRKLKLVHHVSGSLSAALKPKADNTAGTVRHIFFCKLMIFIFLQPRIIDPCHFWMLCQIFRNLFGNAFPCEAAAFPDRRLKETHSGETEWNPNRA